MDHIQDTERESSMWVSGCLLAERVPMVRGEASCPRSFPIKLQVFISYLERHFHINIQREWVYSCSQIVQR